MSEHETVGVVLVGLGPNGQARLREMRACAWIKLVAVCDQCPERVREVSAATGVFGSTELHECLARPGAQAVHCATSTPGHAPVSIAALRAGKHVFCEKPMAIRHEDAHAMLAAERESGCRLQVNFELRSSRAPQRVHELVHAGEIGELNSAVVEHCRGGWGSTGGYRLDPDVSGGAIMECPIHHIDELRWIGGDIRSVQVFRSPTVLPRYPQDLADNFTAIFEWEAGLYATMIVMHARCASTLPVPGDYEHAEAWTARGHHQTFTLIGTEGSLVYDHWNMRLLLFRYNHQTANVDFVREENFRHSPPGEIDHNTAGHVAEFYRRIREGRPPVQSAEDAWRSTATALAAEHSARQPGTKVAVRY